MHIWWQGHCPIKSWHISVIWVLLMCRKQMMELRGTTVDESQILATVQPIANDSHLIANQYSNYGVYLLNMLLPGILQMLVLLMTVFTIGMNWNKNYTWLVENSQQLDVCCLLCWYLAIYTILFSIFIGQLILYEYMHFPMNGSIIRFLICNCAYVIAYQATGVFCIGLILALREAISLVAVYSVGDCFTGFTFPIEAMPLGCKYFNIYFLFDIISKSM